MARRGEASGDCFIWFAVRVVRVRAELRSTTNLLSGSYTHNGGGKNSARQMDEGRPLAPAPPSRRYQQPCQYTSSNQGQGLERKGGPLVVAKPRERERERERDARSDAAEFSFSL